MHFCPKSSLHTGFFCGAHFWSTFEWRKVPIFEQLRTLTSFTREKKPTWPHDDIFYWIPRARTVYTYSGAFTPVVPFFGKKKKSQFYATPGIWFGSWGPSWFDRITNQEQLCGSWKHVSLWDITSSMSSNTYKKASWCENWTFEGTRSTSFETLNIPRDCWCTWFLSRQTTGFTVLSWFWVVFPKT